MASFVSDVRLDPGFEVAPTLPLPLEPREGLGDTRPLVEIEMESFFFLPAPELAGPPPVCGLISGDGRTLLARASAVVLRFLRIFAPDELLPISASGDAVGVEVEAVALKAGELWMLADE